MPLEYFDLHRRCQDESLLVFELTTKSPGERLFFLQDFITHFVSQKKGKYQSDWQKLDEELSKFIEFLFFATEDMIVLPFYDSKGYGEWEPKVDSWREIERAAKDVILAQAREAMAVYRQLPKYGSASISQMNSGGDPTMAGAEIMVYEKTRQVLLAKVAKCWAIVESEETVEEMLSFLIEVALGRTIGPYGSSAVKALRDVDKLAPSFRISKALMRIYPYLRDHGPIQDVFDVLQIGWVKKMSHAQVRFLAETTSILDRSLPECAEITLHSHEKLAARMVNTAKSFIEHCQTFHAEWEWVSFLIEKLTIVLYLKVQPERFGDWKERAQKSLQEKATSWKSPDPKVRIIVHGRDRSISDPKSEAVLFTVNVPFSK